MEAQNLTPNKKQTATNEISLQEFAAEFKNWWSYLLSKWTLILGFSVLGAVAALTYALVKRPFYTATTTFVLEDGGAGGGNLGQIAGLASLVGLDIGDQSQGIFQGDNIAALYKSRAMLERTLLTPVNLNGKQQLLIDKYVEVERLRNKWSGKPELANIRFTTASRIPATRLQDSLISKIVEDIDKKYLVVGKPDKKLNIISVEFKARDESLANAFNQTIVKVVNDFYIQTKTKKALNNIEVLQRKTDSVKNVMNGAISTAAAAVDRTPNLNMLRQSQRVVPVQKATFLAESNKLILGELVKNLELSKMNFLKDKPLIQVIDSPVLPLEKEKSLAVKLPIVCFFLAGILISFILAFIRFFRNMEGAG